MSKKIDKNLVYSIIKKYKDEIFDTTDWWYGFDHHDINVFCLDDEPYQLEAVYQINVYTLGDRGVDDMFEEEENMMPPITRIGIRML
jgi:hypothetical protein